MLSEWTEISGSKFKKKRRESSQWTSQKGEWRKWSFLPRRRRSRNLTSRSVHLVLQWVIKDGFFFFKGYFRFFFVETMLTISTTLTWKKVDAECNTDVEQNKCGTRLRKYLGFGDVSRCCDAPRKIEGSVLIFSLLHMNASQYLWGTSYTFSFCSP